MEDYGGLIRQADQTAAEGKTEEAIQQYEEAIQLEPERVEAYYSMALLYHRRGQLDEAINSFEKAAELCSDDASIFNNLGVLYYSKGDLGNAERNFKKAIEMENDYANALYGLGKVYQKYAGAEIPLNPPIQKREERGCLPSRKGAVVASGLHKLERHKAETKNRIERLHGQGSVEEARSISEKLIKLSPDSAESYNDHAVLNYEMGRIEDARRAIDKAKELAPGDVDIQINYRAIYEEVEKRAKDSISTLPSVTPSSDVKVMYVSPMGTAGLIKAYRRASQLKLFDYRTLAARHGAEEMNRMLFEAALQFRPDVIHLEKAESIGGATIKAIKDQINTYVVYEYGDFRWKLEDYVISLSSNADTTLFQLTDDEVLDRYRAAGVKNIGEFWGITATDPDVLYPRDVEKTRDIVFMGSNWYFSDEYDGYPKRRQLMEAILHRGLDLHIYGANWGYLLESGYETLHLHPIVPEAEVAEICSSAKITLGINAVNDVRMCASWRRACNAMASGAFHLTHYVPGMETVFENRRHLVWFGSIPEAMELIKYYLTHDDERNTIAKAGKEEVMAHHIWDVRVAEIISRWQKVKAGA